VEEVVELEEVIMEVEEEEEPMEEEASEEEVTMREEETTAEAATAAAPEVEEEEEDREARKQKDYDVFVGGLPLDAAEEDVTRALAEAGEVAEVRLARDPADPKFNRGFAFVRFTTAWEARWAANDLHTATVTEILLPFH
jgi:RNA recognition motif-containing protein